MNHGPREGKNLGALAVVRADGGIPVGPFPQDCRHCGEGFHVVDQGGCPPEPLLGRKGWPGAGGAAAPLDRLQQGGFFTAYVGTGPHTNIDAQVELAGKDAHPQDLALACLLEG